MIPGFLLLGSHLGDPQRPILTQPQLNQLTGLVESRCASGSQGELTEKDLQALGCGGPLAERILSLLSDQSLLKAYLSRAEHHHIFPVTRGDPDYPVLPRKRLGGRCPGCFFGNGNRQLLNTPAIALVGSRDLTPQNRAFAREAGRQAAAHGLTLISGNARGADREAQDSCLNAGGSVISVVADGLEDKFGGEHLLYLSQEDFDAPFSAQRALSRNRIIHTMGYLTLVAQCSLETGGTWSGTVQNLQKGWTLVVCFRDGSDASRALEDRGAYLLDIGDIRDLSNLRDPQLRLF